MTLALSYGPSKLYNDQNRPLHIIKVKANLARHVNAGSDTAEDGRRYIFFCHTRAKLKWTLALF